MKLKEICSYLDSVIPLSFQEDYDNSGLQIGVSDSAIEAALITLDITEDVVDEAIREGCNLIVSHHPLIFRGIKRLTDNSPAGRVLLRAAINNIAVYSAHTNLDSIEGGVSFRLAERLNLQNIRVLSPLKNRLMKLVTFIPADYFKTVSDAVFDAGAGVIGNYDKCSFSVGGTGSFRAGEKADPFVGEKNKIHFEPEMRFETVFWSHLKNRIIDALIGSHPYEEVAYDIYPLGNENINAGLGCTGDLEEAVAPTDFVKMISSALDAKGLRYSQFDRPVKKVALCGGSGSSLLEDAIGSGADAFITGDIKYHTFHEAGGRIMVIDCGHYDTEKYAVEILYELIIKKFPTFAVRFSKINTNPINYL